MADFLGLAFVAGLLAFFSPCSVALVPAYIGLYLPGQEGGAGSGATAKGGPALPRRFVAGLMAFIVASAALLVSAAYVVGPIEGGVQQGPWRLPVVAALASAVATAAAAGWTWLAAEGLPRETHREIAAAAVRGVLLGVVVSAGFVTVFGTAGLAIAATEGAASDLLPFIAMASAVLLLFLGASMVAGRPVTLTLRVFAPQKAGWVSSYLFGVGYAFVSSGCLLPVFVLVVNAAIHAGEGGGVGGGLASFAVMIAYAVGYSVMMVALATYVSVTRNATLGAMRRLLPHVERVAGAVVIGAALYIVWYDVTSVLPSL